MPRSPFDLIPNALSVLSTLPSLDTVLGQADRALKSLTTTPTASRPNPAHTPQVQKQAQASAVNDLDPATKTHIAGLMRVNHVGEVCAQALYQAQAMATNNPELKAVFEKAAQEEADHLAWTADRLKELDARPSLLNPVWFMGAYGLGLVAGRFGDTSSLSFMAETEKQVEHHLAKHLKQLPNEDVQTRAILEQMQADEIAHGSKAQHLGGQSLPLPLRLAMKGMAKIMTTVAHKI